MTQPTAKSIDVARRAAEIAEGAAARVLVVANRVRDDDDLLAIRTALAEKELIVVPDDPVIAAADREGRAPIDVGPDAPGFRSSWGWASSLPAKLAPDPTLTAPARAARNPKPAAHRSVHAAGAPTREAGVPSSSWRGCGARPSPRSR